MVKNLRSANATARLRNTSLALGALVAYQINALIYRPAEGRAETELLATASQHIYDATNSSKPIMYDRGAYFCSDIVDDREGFLLPNVRPVSSCSILALYSRDFMDDIEAEFEEAQSQRDIPDAPHTTPHNTRQESMLKKKRRTTSRVVEEGISDTSDTSTEESMDITAPTVAPVPRIKDTRGLTDLLRQFPSDILQLVPNPKSSEEEPWCLLTKGDVSQAKIELFQSLNIRHIFRLAQCTMVCADDWQTTVFGRYFPRKGFQPPKSLQHYPIAAYYRQWRHLMEDATDEGTADGIRETVRVWFNKVLWIPFPEGDRMWSTRRANGNQWKMLPTGASIELSPRIAINVDRCEKRAIAELWAR